MKITPVASPAQIQQAPVESEQARTARLTQKFTQILNRDSQPAQAQQAAPTTGQAQLEAVANPSKVSVEELSAIQPKQQAEQPETQDNITPEKTQDQPKVDPELQRRFDQMQRQERALRAKAQQEAQKLKAREDAIAAKEKELAGRTQFNPDDYIPKARLKQDALGTLEAEGITTYDDITQRAMNRQPVDPVLQNTIQQLQEQIKDLKAQSENSQKAMTQQQQANYQAAVKQIKADAKQLVYTDPEFETVKAMNAVNDVVELIEQTFAKDGVVLSVEEAAKEVENYLVEEAMKITQIEKIRKRMAAANASQLKSDVKPQTQQQPQMKTLTNATSSTRPLTTRERAIAAAEGRLKA